MNNITFMLLIFIFFYHVLSKFKRFDSKKYKNKLYEVVISTDLLLTGRKRVWEESFRGRKNENREIGNHMAADILPREN